MTIQILMPALSPTMTEGKLVVWHKQEGDAITPGDVIAEIETDKATMEIEAIDEGIMGKILVAAGTEGVPVNALIAIVLEDGESAGDIDMSRTAGAAPAPTVPTSTAPIQRSCAPVAPAPVGAAAGGRVFASPLARRMAEQAGVDLSGVAGSGPNGRVVKMDVEAVIASGPRTSAAPAPSAQGPAAFTATPPSADVPGCQPMTRYRTPRCARSSPAV